MYMIPGTGQCEPLVISVGNKWDSLPMVASMNSSLVLDVQLIPPPFHGQEGGKDYLQNKILGFIIFLAFGENFGAEG